MTFDHNRNRPNTEHGCDVSVVRSAANHAVKFAQAREARGIGKKIRPGRRWNRRAIQTSHMIKGECQWQVGDELVHAKPGTYVFIPLGLPHNISNASDKPARMIMTVSPPGHEHYFEELVKLVTRSGPPDADAIANLRRRFDTEQQSALKAS